MSEFTRWLSQEIDVPAKFGLNFYFPLSHIILACDDPQEKNESKNANPHMGTWTRNDQEPPI
jgi:hypothetical protein